MTFPEYLVGQSGSDPDQPGARLRVAALQTSPTCGEISGNLRQIERMLARVSAADLVVTPELSVSGYPYSPELVPPAMDATDERLSRLVGSGPAISFGIVERSDCGKPYDACVLIGSTISVQRKLHLVSYAPWSEQACFTPGSDGLVQTEVNGVQIATLICNDAWHPVMPWLAVHSGAEVLIVPTASSGIGSAHESAKTWLSILTHTARTLQCFVVFANRSGSENGSTFWGGSRIIGPRGEILSRATNKSGIIQADLDIASLRKLRRDTPLLAEEEPELTLKYLQDLIARHASV